MTQLVLCCCFQTEWLGSLLCERRKLGMSQASRVKNAELLQGTEHPHSPVLLCWLPPQFHSAAPGSHQATQQFTQEQSSSAVHVLKQECRVSSPRGPACCVWPSRNPAKQTNKTSTNKQTNPTCFELYY